MAADYLTVAELASTLTLTETFADADLAVAITAASRDVDRRCDRKFWTDNGSRYYTPTNARKLWIDDLTALSSVTLDYAGDGSFSSSWTQGAQFTLEPLNATADGHPWTTIAIRQLSAAYFPAWDRSVKVTGTFGWAAVPSSVKQATSILAGRFMKRGREAPFGVAGFGIDGGAVHVSRYDPDVDALLAPFVRTQHEF